MSNITGFKITQKPSFGIEVVGSFLGPVKSER